MSKNTQHNELSSSTQEIFDNVFTVIPALKDMYTRVQEYNRTHDKPLTIGELFKDTITYSANNNVFPENKNLAFLVGQKVAKVYNDQELGKKYEQQLLNTSSVLNMQVHFSLLRNFDFISRPPDASTQEFIKKNRFHEDGHVKPNEQYNSVILNSEVLWIALCQHFGILPLSTTFGGITGANETSAAYLQYGSHPESSLKIMTGDHFARTMCGTFAPSQPNYYENILKSSKEVKPSDLSTFPYLLTDEHIEQRNNLQDKTSRRYQQTHAYLQELQEHGFNHGVSRVYTKQLNNLYDESPEVRSIEMGDLQSHFLAHLIEDKNTLTHYIYCNKDVYKLFLDTYGGIAMGWEGTPTEDGTIAYDTIYSTRPTISKKPDQGKKCAPAIGFIYNPETQEGHFPEGYSPENLVQGFKDGTILPKTIQLVIANMVEAGIIPIGGVAQINYNKCVVESTKKFFRALKEGIEQNKYPPLPESLSFDNLDKRMQLIEENQTPITLAGFGIIPGERSYDIGHYGPFIEGKKLPKDIHEQIVNMDAQKAIERMILALHEYKLGNKGFNRLVGDQHISLAQRELSAEEKERFITETRCIHPAFTGDTSLHQEAQPSSPKQMAVYEQKTLDNKRSLEL